MTLCSAPGVPATAILGPDLCLPVPTDPPYEGRPRGDDLSPPGRPSTALICPLPHRHRSQLAVIAAALLTDAIEASAELETYP